jgi:molybdopterin-guanine dinucleotide biosynthesis protein A
MDGLSGVDGLVLAGGMSRRFGADKRVAILDGQELVRIAIRKMRAGLPGCRIWVGTGRVRERLPGMGDAQPLVDLVVGRGPLGAIAAALRQARWGVVVLACDVPLLRPATLARVAAAGAGLRRPAAVRTARGWEPLVAYYPKAVSNLVEAALSHGRAAPHMLLDRTSAVAVRVSDLTELANVNTLGDLETIARASPRIS